MFDAGKIKMIGLPYNEKQELSYRQQIARLCALDTLRASIGINITP